MLLCPWALWDAHSEVSLYVEGPGRRRAGFTCSHTGGLGRSHGVLWSWDGPSELCSTEARRQDLCPQLPLGRVPNKGPGSFLPEGNSSEPSAQLPAAGAGTVSLLLSSTLFLSPAFSLCHCLGSASPSVSTFSM